MSELEETRRRFLESLSRIAEFWGYPRAMGALYAALYLAPGPLSLDELVTLVGLSKGSVSTNIRALEQLGMVRRELRWGDRKDYYQANTDFWRITKTILERRQKPEFDQALHDVSLSLQQVRSGAHARAEAELARFFEQRLEAIESFFRTVDGMVALILQMDRLRVHGLKSLLSARPKRKKGT
jgi:HTH-type transcriptional regulator, glycine betaine synthesis regulator